MGIPEGKSRALEFIEIILDTIKEAGDQGIPSGHLYAAVMSVVDIDTYTILIQYLVLRKLITNSGHLLKFAKKEA